MKLPSTKAISQKRMLGLTLLAWLGVLGFDFFLHGGLLASLYLSGSSFLLDPAESFRRIPIGYLSFLISTGFLVWLSAMLGVRGWRRGSMLGALTGGMMWLSLGLGLFSISTAPANVLLAWFLGQTLEMAYAGGLIGAGLAGNRDRKLTIAVAGLTVLFIVLTVILQSIGLAPAQGIPSD